MSGKTGIKADSPGLSRGSAAGVAADEPTTPSGSSGAAAVRRPRRRIAAAGHRRRRAGTLLVLTLATALAVVGGAASPAWAHAILERATPAGGTAVATAPTNITLGFSEAVRTDANAIRVIDTHGTRVDTGGAHSGAHASDVTVALKPGLPKGTYLVSWRVISADSHPIAGGYAFGIGEAPAAGAAAAASATPKGSALTGFTFGLARLVAFAGMALLLGAVFLLVALWPGGLRRRAPRLLIVGGWVAVFVGSVACLLLQGVYASGLGLSALARWDPLGATLGDRYGRLTLIRLLALLLALPLLRGLVWTLAEGAADSPPPAGAVRPSRWVMAELGGLAVAVAATTALVGHAGAGSWSWLAASSLTVHLLAMSIWLGGLAVLAAGLLDRRASAAVTTGGQGVSAGWASAVERGNAGETDEEADLAAARAYLDEQGAEAVPVPAARAAELASVLPRWSRTAMAAVAAIVVSGTYQTWREVGTLPALFDTDYGRLLLYKLWFVLAMLGIGYISQRWIRHHYRPVALAMTAETDPVGRGVAHRRAAGGGLDGAKAAAAPATPDADGSGREVTVGALAALRRGVIAEAVIAIAVLAVTAVLINRVPGRSSYAPPFHTTTVAGPLTVDVRVSPTRIGLEGIEVTVRDPQGQPQRLVEASVTLSLPAAQVGPLEVPVVAAGTGALVTQDAQVPLPGDWRMTITLRINDFDQYSTTVTYRVR
ncbi:copper resistance protein CopC [Pseudofrankia sp. BMG5.36]|uniref:copper resistance protein CopC n=1 Tax=Pseudofrankia sp. BMG5.36 TaxID=1834512 RepID=UPI001F519FC3|nr:copper resistance protein CopC [Pseudofrankia sp. BMG5.36]